MASSTSTANLEDPSHCVSGSHARFAFLWTNSACLVFLYKTYQMIQVTSGKISIGWILHRAFLASIYFWVIGSAHFPHACPIRLPVPNFETQVHGRSVVLKGRHFVEILKVAKSDPSTSRDIHDSNNKALWKTISRLILEGVYDTRDNRILKDKERQAAFDFKNVTERSQQRPQTWQKTIYWDCNRYTP